MECLHLTNQELVTALRICAKKRQRDDCFKCPLNGKSDYYCGGCRTQLIDLAAEAFTKLRVDNAHKRLKLNRAGRLIADLKQQLQDIESHANYMETCRESERMRNDMLRARQTCQGARITALEQRAARVAAENVALKKKLLAASVTVDELKKEIAMAKKLIPVSDVAGSDLSFLEALRRYHPSCIAPCFSGGVLGCPDDYFTGNDAIAGNRPCMEKPVFGPIELDSICRACWNRKVDGDS